MVLSNDLISQFVKATKDKDTSKKETTVYGTAVEYNGDIYVRVDGSDHLTPVTKTTNVNVGERVTVMIKNHTATVTGNLSSPSARTGDVEVIGDQVSAFDTILADCVRTDTLNAQVARIDDLVAGRVDILGRLTASEADIEWLEVNKLNAETAALTYATIKDLDATTIKVDNLSADYGNFTVATADRLTAVEAFIDNLDIDGTLTVESLEGKFANIDFSNIGVSAIKTLYATSGIIKDATISDGVVTGTLSGVTITGDLIKANTILADRLVIKGTDGLYYKLNTDGMKTEAQQTDQNSLNGSIILAKSIAASKISVTDLVAFGATIGGFHIGDNSLYSGVKSAVNNTTRGIYLDTNGQANFGDANNFVKYYKDTDGTYKLAITADTFKFSASNKSIAESISTLEQTSTGLTVKLDSIKVGGRNLIIRSAETVGRYIGTDGSDVSAVACSLSEYIAIEPNSEYVFTKTTGIRDNYFRYAWYDSNKTYIGRVANANNEFLWTSPSNAHYIRISYPSECTVKFERGNKSTGWSPAPEDLNSDISGASRTATNYLNYSGAGLIVGDHTASTLGKNVRIGSDAVEIRTGSVVNALFGGDIIELAKNNESATISMLNGAFKIYYDADNSDGGFGVYGVTSKGVERLAFQPVNENDNLTIGWGGYDAGENRTNIYGNKINLFAKEGVSFTPGEGQYVEINGNAYIPNGRNLFVTNAAGDKRSALMCNSSNQVFYGYGSYVNSEGTVYYDGNTVNIRSKNDVVINGRSYGKNQILWSGGRYMSADHTCVLSSSISTQPHGVVLVFSQYVDGAAANQSFIERFIPKTAISTHSGKGHCVHLSTSSLSLFATKYLYISDTQITGHDNNVAYGTSDCGIKYANSNFVLRYVIGV